MITITDTDLEETLKFLLQKQASFVIKKKKWRCGRVILFKQNGFYIEFTLKTNKEKNEKFEVPIPFNIYKTSDRISFSYELEELVCNNHQVIKDIEKLGNKCKSKYFNSVLEIQL